MALKLDSRQTRQRSKLDQLSTTTDLRLDAIMNLINDELTMPLRMRANLGAGVDGTPNQNLYIDSIFVKTLDTGAADNGHERSRTIPPIGGVLPSYSGGGYIAFPTTSGGSITGSGLTLDKAYTLTLTSGQYVKILVWLNASSQFGMEIGTSAASEAAAVLPAPPTNAFALGYIVMNNTGGTISKVLNENVYQFAGGGGAGGGTGTGQGEINLITDSVGALGGTNWSVTGLTATRDTSGSPLDPVVATGWTLTATAASQYFTSTALVVPSSLRNRKLKIEFYYTQVSGSNFRLEVARNSGFTNDFALTTDVSGVTNLPATAGTTGKFTAYFDSDSTSPIYVRLGSTGAGSIKITQIVLGPGIQPQGAVVGPYSRDTSFTIGASTTAPTPGTGAAYFREVTREGADAIIRWEYYQTAAGSAGSGNYRLPLPSGLTIDLTRYREASTTYRHGFLASSGFLNTSAATYAAQAAAEEVASPTYVTVQLFNDASTNLDWGSTNGSLATAGTLGLTVTARVPIAEWAGSGTVQLAQNDVEYAYSTDTTTTAGNTQSDNGLYGYGPRGTTFVAVDSNTANNETTKRVRFQTPIQPGDRLQIEVQQDTSSPWVPVELANGPNGYRLEGTGRYGIGLKRISGGPATDIYVAFGNGGGSTYKATAKTYGELNTDAWSGYTSYRWRVRKSSGGSAVGFGIVQPGVSSGLVSASGVPGNTTGSAIASGYVGELYGTQRNGTNGFSYSTRSTTSVPTTTAASVVSVSVAKGVYLVSYKIRCASNTTSNLDAALYVGGTQVEATNSQGYATSAVFGSASNCLPVVVTADNTTIAVFARLDTGTSASNSHELWVTRIA